jgi:fumarate hydratase class II
MCTSLAPVIGYDRAAQIAKEAYQSGRTVREVALEMSGLDQKKLDELLDARRLTGP